MEQIEGCLCVEDDGSVRVRFDGHVVVLNWISIVAEVE